MKQSRRNFLGKTLGYLPFIGLFSLVFPFFSFINYSKKKGKIEIPIDKLTSNITKIDKHDLFIIKTTKGYKVFDAHCTHMGCIVNYNDKKNIFECPCHGSIFSQNGQRIRGPAKKPLKQLTFRVANNNLIIE
jgi:cytochrome b6-f complex iron-sulfur subunit